MSQKGEKSLTKNALNVEKMLTFVNKYVILKEKNEEKITYI